jgi:hypothetical protein
MGKKVCFVIALKEKERKYILMCDRAKLLQYRSMGKKNVFLIKGEKKAAHT